MQSTKGKLFEHAFLRKAAIVLLITAIFLSLLLVFFQMSQNSLIQSLTQMNNEFGEQIDTISGTLLEIIHNTAMQMFYSRSLAKLRTVDALTNAERIAGLRDLGNWVSSSTFLSSAMIYNSITDTIFASDGGHTKNAQEFYDDQATVELMVSQEKHGSSGPVKRQTAEGDTYSFLFFESNVPHGGSLLVNVRAQWYEHQLLGISTEHSGVVVDHQGTILVTADESLTEKTTQIWPDLLERFDENQSHGFILDPSGKSGCMYYQLTNLGVYYLTFFETETILPGLSKVRNSTVTLLIAVTAVLIAGALYTLFTLYLPFRAIRAALQRSGTTELGVVQQVDQLLESQLEQRLTRQMASLLQGVEMNIIGYPASLVLVATADCAKVREAVKNHTVLPSLTAINAFGCAILVSGIGEEQASTLCVSLASALNCRCLYGRPRDSADELAQSYANLSDLWQQRFLYAGQQVLSEKLTESYYFPLDFKTNDTEPLFSFLRGGQLEDARAEWKRIFDRIRYAKSHNFRFFVSYILKYLTTMQSELGLEPLINARDIFDNLEDVARLHQLLDSMCAQIVTAQDSRRKDNLQHLAAKINERITVGYADDNLSAQSIADEMGMNAVYVGRLYRESTGISIAETIKRTRVENAKRLLKESSDPVREIAGRVGFSNTKYFFVVFKDLVGMTPKEFQNRG